MNDASEELAHYCIFEYLYRDGGNWKTFGSLLLSGHATEAASSAIKQALDYGDTFVAEQVGIPSLCAQHFRDCGADGAGELDHAYHEFFALRSATQEDVHALTVFGPLADMVQSFKRVDGRWDVRLSPNVVW